MPHNGLRRHRVKFVKQLSLSSPGWALYSSLYCAPSPIESAEHMTVQEPALIPQLHVAIGCS